MRFRARREMAFRSVLFLSWVVILAAAEVSPAAYTLSATNLTVSPAAGITSVVLTAESSTNIWTATANTNWLNLVTCGGTSNSDSVVFGFQVNTGPMRTGTLTIAGLTLTVRQQGAAVATTLAATEVGITNATFHGLITPNAGATAGFFQYSTNGGWLVDTVVTGISEYCSARSSLSRDHDGNFYICVPDCSEIYRIAATGGVSVLPRPPEYVFGLSWRPANAIVDEDGNLYVAEFWCIRRYNVTTAAWSVFAGDPTVTQQSVDGTGTEARFSYILGMTRDCLGNFYVGCMYNIRHVTTNAVVTTLTDQGTSVGQRDGPAFGASDVVALIDGATGIAVDDYSGNLYWGEYMDFRCVRKLNLTGTGMVTTLAGSDSGYADGTGSVARFQYPMNALMDYAGSLFVVDTAVNNRIRRVTPEGVVTTLDCLDAATGDSVTFSYLVGGMVDSNGYLLVIDHGHDAIRQVGYRLSDPVTVSSQSGLTGTNAVGITNTISGLHPGTTYYYWTAATNSTSTNHGEVLSFTTLSTTSSLTLASALDTTAYGEDATFIATVVTNVPGWPAATGTVVFKDGAVPFGTATLNGGVAVLTTNSLELGSHSINAEFPGDRRYFGSTNTTPITQTVTQGVPQVVTWPTAGTISYGQTLASSTLTGGSVTPTGAFEWVDSGIAPDIGTASHEVVFIPTDTVRYITVTGTVSVTVNKAASDVTEWPTATSINLGYPLSASTLIGGSATPAGAFAWKSPTNRLHAGTASQGVTFTPDDTNRYLNATGTVSVTINPVPTTNGLTSSRNLSAAGERVTFSVIISPVSSNCYVPGGTVTFKDGVTILGTGTLSGGATAFSTAGLDVGPHSITAEYPGNADFLGSTSTPPLAHAVDPALVVLRNPDTNAAALSATVLNTQQTVAAVFKVGTGNMRLVSVGLRLRCDFATTPYNDSVRCTLYDVTTNNTPNTALAACDSSVLNIAKNDTSWYPVAFSGELRDYVLEANHTYALGISIPTAGTATDRSIKNITAENTPYTMAWGYTFVQNVRSTTATPAWSFNMNRFGIVLTGSEVPRTSTTIEVGSDLNPSAYGSSVTFTSTVSPAEASGDVTFKDGGVTLGTGTVSEGVAVFSTHYLSIGNHEITVEYGGDLNYEGSVSSSTYTQAVISPPAVTTLAATNVNDSGATLCGRVNPNGWMADGFFRYATNAGWLAGTLAGGTNSGYADGIGSAAHFTRPTGVAVDGAGCVVVADYVNCRIRRITPLGEVTTLAGTNIPSYADGTGSMARFSAPYGVAVDQSNTIVVADYLNNCIRKVTLDGVVTTLAGTNAYGYADGTGYEARFFRPQGVAVDGSGTVFVADTYNHCIRRITAAGVVTTLAGSTNAGYADGTGSAAQFYRPSGVAVDGAGTVFVADYLNNCIRQITPAGVVSTLAGTTNSGYADGPAGTALFKWPSGVAVDGAGNVFVADNGNNCIRLISPGGVVTTLAGTTNSGYADGIGSAAQFYWPFGVTVATAGNLYVADTYNHCIRKLVNTPIAPVTTVAAQGGLTGDEDVDIHATVSDLESGTTYYFQALAVSGSGTNYGAVLGFTTRTAATVTVDSNPNPSTYGSNVTFTSTVSPGDASGSVTFKDGAATLGTGTLSGGQATLTTNSLSSGSHDISAEYSGDSNYGASVSSPAYTQTVDRAVPNVSTWPAASGIVAGESLSASLLSGGNASVEGGFAWTEPAYAPPAGTSGQSVTFTPTDSGNYSNAVGLVTITVFGGRVQAIVRTNGTVGIRCGGAPGAYYHVDRTTSLTEPVVWTRLTVDSPLLAGSDGLSEFIDDNPPQATAIFYRLVQSEE